MVDNTLAVRQFFAQYAAALLARDAKAVAPMYAVPSLILFPGTPILVSDASQTEAFFASAWDQYDGIDDIASQITILAEAPSCIWADVTWTYGDEHRERFCYQLIKGADGWQIAVLTPMT